MDKPAGARPFRWLIEYIEDTARSMGPHTLAEFHMAFLERYPQIEEGRNRQRFSATLQFHCVNTRARFPFPDNPARPARWMTRPLFKRVGRKHYQLLSEEERSCFVRRLTACDRLLFLDEYDAQELTCAI